VIIDFFYCPATVPARGTASLGTHLNFLGKPLLLASLDINVDGWIVAQRIKLIHQDLSSDLHTPRYQPLTLDTVPLTIKIDTSALVGQGSMRKAYTALVKTGGQNGGPTRITNWVAKVRYHDSYPNIHLHATNARMYRATSHLLQDFQTSIAECNHVLLTRSLRRKALAFEVCSLSPIITHASETIRLSFTLYLLACKTLCNIHW
jgi:hypothetical protein